MQNVAGNGKKLSLFWLTIFYLLCLPLLSLAAEANVPRHGGDLHVALPAEPPGLDPTTNSSAVIDRLLYNNVYEGLVKVNRDGEVVPGLAKDWKISSDKLTYIFHLRENVQFHNGKELKAKDVEFTFRRNMENPRIVHPEYFKPIESISTPDEKTVSIQIKEPNSSFLFNLARGDSVILPTGESESLKSHPVGTGPFQFAGWKRGSYINLTRFPQYYREGIPYLQSVRFEFISDPNARLQALRAGDIDAIAYGTNPANAKLLQQSPRFKVLNGVTTGEVILAMNNSRKPFSNLKVRKAINYGLDKEAIIEGAMFGFGQEIGSLMSPASPEYIDLTWLYPHDPEKAKKLLEESGYPDGFQAKLKLPYTYDYALRAGKIVADQLRKIGVKVEIEKVGWGQWIERVFSNADYDMTIIGHVEAFDISIYANPDYYFRYDNPRLQTLLERADRTVDSTKRKVLYGIVQWIIAEEVPSAFLFELPSLPAMKKNVMNWWRDYPIIAADVSEVWLGETED